jgi:hypothetical protein
MQTDYPLKFFLGCPIGLTLSPFRGGSCIIRRVLLVRNLTTPALECSDMGPTCLKLRMRWDISSLTKKKP